MNKKIIDRIRQYYQLPNEITDKQIAKDLKGSFGESIMLLNAAKENLIKAYGEGMPRVLKGFKNITIKSSRPKKIGG